MADFDPIDSAQSPDWPTIQHDTSLPTREIIEFLYDRVKELEGLVGVMTRKASGFTGVADGGTIAHGLPEEPRHVQATASVSGEFVSVVSKTRTTFTVAIKTHANGVGTTQNIYWEAEI